MDFNEIARASVERAVQAPLTPLIKADSVKRHPNKKKHARNQQKPMKSV